MKTAGYILLGALLTLIAMPKDDGNYPIPELIAFENKTFEEEMITTELYKKTIIVEDTIQETQKIIKELKSEKTY